MLEHYPCIEINLSKISHNTNVLVKLCKDKGIDVVGVTKVFCARRPIVKAMLDGGLNLIGDSRIENLKNISKISKFSFKKMLLRIPMESDAEEVVKYSDISLNSEIETIKRLNEAATALKVVHNIILMVDIGDLREGILEEEAVNTVREVLKYKNIHLSGIGTNLTCYGGVIPDAENLGRLIMLREKLKQTFNINLDIISGGNSSSIYLLLENKMPGGINQLRIGEGIVLGRETSFGGNIPGCYPDCFILKGEIIEIKNKPSIPKGRIGMDAFGQTPHFEDKGIMKRAILALGRQDITFEGLKPFDDKISVIGASSDHLLLDVTKCPNQYKVGDIVNFTMDYGCLLRAMTSIYVKKYYIE